MVTLTTHTWKMIEDLQHPFPFLICPLYTTDISQHFDDWALYELPNATKDDVTKCHTDALAVSHARQLMESAGASVQPIIDVMKLSSGVIDEITSPE